MSATPRLAASAVGLIIQGAFERSDYGPEMAQREFEEAILLAIASELSDWLETNPDLAAKCAVMLAP